MMYNGERRMYVWKRYPVIVQAPTRMAFTCMRGNLAHDSVCLNLNPEKRSSFHETHYANDAPEHKDQRGDDPDNTTLQFVNRFHRRIKLQKDKSAR